MTIWSLTTRSPFPRGQTRSANQFDQEEKGDKRTQPHRWQFTFKLWDARDNFSTSGLDPARPLFELPLMHPRWRLERSDAEFVDIIHTCAGILGYKKSHGHADYYPNSGKPAQPGCEGLQQILG